MKSVKLLSSLIAMMILVAGCAPVSKAPSAIPDMTSMPADGYSVPSVNTGTVFSDQLAIDIKGFAFNPQNATVKVGTQVTWTNKDSAPHTVTASDRSFDSGTLNQGQSFTFQFTTPGTFSYACTIHPSMQATIIVVQ
jgi:plastocyanin